MLVTWNFRDSYYPPEVADDPIALREFLAEAPPGRAESLLFLSVGGADPAIQRVLTEFVTDKTAHDRQGFTYLESLVEEYGDARDQWRDDAHVATLGFLESIALALEYGFRPRREHKNAFDLARIYGLHDVLELLEPYAAEP